MSNDDGGCLTCAILEAQLAAARRRIAALEARVQQLERRIQRMRQRIQLVQAFCLKVLADAQHVLGQKSGVPRGIWSFAKGGRAVALRVLALLGNEGQR